MPAAKFWDGAAWQTIAAVQGPTGPQGPKGDTGATGATGGNATVTMDTWHWLGAAGELAPNSGFTPLSNTGYRKYPDGVVRLHGYFSSPVGGGTLFNLPIGYRPARMPRFIVETETAGGVVGTGRLLIDPTTGAVILDQSSNATKWDIATVEFDTESVTSVITGPQGPAGPTGATGGNATVPMDTWHYVGGSGEPAFAGAWKNYDNDAAAPGTGTQRSLRFRKNPLGVVRIAGTVKSTAAGLLFTLPSGYQPKASQSFSIQAANGVGFVEIQTSGAVILTNNPGDSAVSVAQFSFMDAVSFDTESVTAMPTGPQGPAGPTGATGGNATVPIEAWRNVGAAGQPPFLGTWFNHSASLPVQFRKLPDGVVEIRGFARGSAGATSVFNLPVAYRPATGQDVLYLPTVIEPGGSPFVLINTATGDVSIAGTYTTAHWVNVTCRFSAYQADFPTGPQGPKGDPGVGGGVTVTTLANRAAASSVPVGTQVFVTDAVSVKKLQISDGTKWLSVSDGLPWDLIILSYTADGDANGLIYFLGSTLPGTTFSPPVPNSGTSLVATGTDLTITASAAPATGTNQYRVCNRVATDNFSSNNGAAGQTLTWDLMTRKLIVNKIFIQHPNLNAQLQVGSCVVEASNDNTTYTPLLTITAPFSTTVANRSYDIVNSTAYRYLRIRMVTAPPGGNFLVFSEVEWYGTLS